MSSFLIAPMLVMAAAGTHVPVILDTDIGDDIDDTWALNMLLGSPEVNLKLIVTSTNDTERKTRLVAKILEAVGRMDVPIGTGVKQNDRTINQEAWLGDYSLDHYSGVVHEDGIGEMINLINQSPEPIVLCVIGPQPNIAAALERDPSIAKKARVVSMAGSVYIGYNGKEKPSPEYNVAHDVASARTVFAAPWEITYASLDICGTLRLQGERYEAVASSDNPRAAVTIANYDQWANRKNYPANSSSILFDTAAAYLTFSEKLCDVETIDLSIDDKGNTVPDDAKGRPVRCALRWTDRDAFEQLLVKALTGPTDRDSRRVGDRASSSLTSPKRERLENPGH